MGSLILDGKKVRDEVFADLTTRVQRSGRRPGLAVVLVGDDPASQVYVNSKGKACEQIGFHHVTHRLPADTDQDTLLELIDSLNGESRIHGILVQIPLPKQISESVIQLAISPAKDVDGLHPMNLGGIVANNPGLFPCTPKGVLRILDSFTIPLAGREVAVVGRSVIVGRPLAMMLSRKTADTNATVTLCHSGTVNLPDVVSRADIVIAAMGSPAALDRRHVRSGAVVVDVGINRVKDTTRKSGYRIVGDVAPEALDGWASAYTPVPGGVGPMTIAMLLENTWDAMVLQEGE